MKESRKTRIKYSRTLYVECFTRHKKPVEISTGFLLFSYL